VRRYRGKLSGPLLDRIDLAVHVPAVDPDDLASDSPGEPSGLVRGRVIAARERQRARGTSTNARMARADLEQHAGLDRSARRMLVDASRRLGLTARGFDRLRRTARTIADLEGAGVVVGAHIAEAVQYRAVPDATAADAD
jgi:magnesium chelatase family protein